jgi:O-antigen/teichoic acid export membrane protein
MINAEPATIPDPQPAAAHDEPALMRRIAGSTVSLSGRRFAITALSGLSVAFVARALGPANYGELASAIATFNLLLGLSDFGFSLTISRELATREHEGRALMQAAFELQSIWALLLALAMAGLALATGIGNVHGQALLVLAPAIAMSGLVSARSIFAVTYTMARLVRIDIGSTAAQVALMIAAARAGLGPPGVAGAVALGYSVNCALAARLGTRLVKRDNRRRTSRRLLARKVLPLGLISFMAQVYLTIDVVILGWLVRGRSLGYYGAASKMLTILQGTAVVAVGAALPALAVAASDPQALSRISTRVWHWLTALGLPCFVGTALFAPLLTRIALSGTFAHTTVYLRILTLAGFIGVASGFLVIVLVAKGVVRPLMIQSAIALVVNVAGNLLLVPHYGVVASAWLTVITEAIVCGCALFTLSRRVDFGPWLAVSWRPLCALAAASAIALALHAWVAAAIPAFVVTYAAVNLALGGWPEELTLARLRRVAPGAGGG